MKNLFFPTIRIDSAYDVNYESLYSKGIRGIIFDIDNTLVKHGHPADDKSIKLFNYIHSLGIKTCLLSNNKKPRVEPFASAINSLYIYNAGKPSTKGYFAAMDNMQTDRHSTIFIGDQIFTDIWGANRAGIKTILVAPINPKEELQIVLKRIPEKLILWLYEKSLGGR